MTPSELLAFEEDIAQEFAAGNIQAPVHLSGGNEQRLIDYFKHVAKEDWICCSWRSHYHCLLKGVPPEKLKAAILAGHSVALCFPEHNILSSGIVGGTAPIALGLAKAGHKVHVFVGDMTYEAGIVHECMKYGKRQNLPISWIIEDNHKSVCTDTQQSWGSGFGWPDIEHYRYTMTRPHVGIGKWVRF